MKFVLKDGKTLILDKTRDGHLIAKLYTENSDYMGWISYSADDIVNMLFLEEK